MLAVLGDSVTTDHISPAGAIKDGPAGAYLIEHGVEPREFNSYGARRGNHEVMMRGTFTNIRLRNQLAPGTEGGVTRYLGDGSGDENVSLRRRHEVRGGGHAARRPRRQRVGSGSSRDWAAKGTNLLGVRAVIAETFERIHRSNLVGMGVAPLQYPEGENAESLGLTGEEEFTITGLAGPLNDGDLPKTAQVKAGDVEFEARVRIDTPKEAEYFRHGGILQYVLRSLLAVSRRSFIGPLGPPQASNSSAAAQGGAAGADHLSIWIGTSGRRPGAGGAWANTWNTPPPPARPAASPFPGLPPASRAPAPRFVTDVVVELGLASGTP